MKNQSEIEIKNCDIFPQNYISLMDNQVVYHLAGSEKCQKIKDDWLHKGGKEWKFFVNNRKLKWCDYGENYFRDSLQAI